MVSAVNQKDKLRECIESGALDFVVKPFDPEELPVRFASARRSQCGSSVTS